MVDALLKMLLTDGVFKSAYNSVTRCFQKEREDEETFARDSGSVGASLPRILKKADVVNHFLCGIKLSVRETFSKQVRIIPATERRNLEPVSQADVEVGIYKRKLKEEEEMIRPETSMKKTWLEKV